MYRKIPNRSTTLSVNKAYEGERIEQKINRIINNKEPIKDGAPIIYSERKDGVNPAYDIRTDRFELAVDAMDKIHKSHIAKREESIAKRNQDKEKKNETTKDVTPKTENLTGQNPEGAVGGA